MMNVLNEGMKMETFMNAPDSNPKVYEDAIAAAIKKVSGNLAI